MILLILPPSTPLIPSQGKPVALMVGDIAPQLTNMEWVANIPSSPIGKPFVVTFFATWLPNAGGVLSDLESTRKKYTNKAFFLAVSLWEANSSIAKTAINIASEKIKMPIAIDKVPDPPKKLEDMSLYARENGELSKSWLVASGQDKVGVPVSYIIDASGRIAWIGKPNFVEDVLDKVIANKWNLQDASKAFSTKMVRLGKASELLGRLNAAQTKPNFPEICIVCEELLAFDPVEYRYCANIKFRTLLVGVRDSTLAYKFGAEAVDKYLFNDPEQLKNFAGFVLDPEYNIIRKDKPLLLKALMRANSLLEETDVQVLTMIAKVYFLDHEPKKAVEWQLKATRICTTEELPQIQKDLELYKRSGE